MSVFRWVKPPGSYNIGAPHVYLPGSPVRLRLKIARLFRTVRSGGRGSDFRKDAGPNNFALLAETPTGEMVKMFGETKTLDAAQMFAEALVERGELLLQP